MLEVFLTKSTVAVVVSGDVVGRQCQCCRGNRDL